VRALVLCALALAAQAAPPRVLEAKGGVFLLDGRPLQIRSGEMHYLRVPRDQWRARMRMMKAMGLNALCTYVFWNAHEPERGRFDFQGDLDLAAYLRTAAEEGLLVLLRPGPYVCAEWEFGGLPAWLLKEPDLKVRTADPRFLDAAGRWIDEVGRRVRDLQGTRGGPIVLVQVENEYGSFGSDPAYKAGILAAFRRAFEVPLYTSDGPDAKLLAAGAQPDLPPAVNFGADDAPGEAFEALQRFRPGTPAFCGEYWTGWFDHVGEAHHVVPGAQGAAGVAWMMARNISFNLYMFHGGTSFGFMNGANWAGRYQPDVTSYDYDALLDEAGRPTPKYFAYRDAIRRALPESLPPVPPAPATGTIPAFRFTAWAGLEGLLGRGAAADRPRTMEALGQATGWILYRHTPAAAARGVLELKDLKDFAVVSQGGRVLGVLDRRLKQTCLDVDLAAGVPLEILVENGGRINFARELQEERKGLGDALLEGKPLRGWEHHCLPMADLSGLRFSARPRKGPAFHRATFRLASPRDTFLDVRGWGKGFVRVNGRNLGRFWDKGPQRALFCPASFLKAGPNEIVVFDLEDRGRRTMAGLADPPEPTRTSPELP